MSNIQCKQWHHPLQGLLTLTHFTFRSLPISVIEVTSWTVERWKIFTQFPVSQRETNTDSQNSECCLLNTVVKLHLKFTFRLLAFRLSFSCLPKYCSISLTNAEISLLAKVVYPVITIQALIQFGKLQQSDPKYQDIPGQKNGTAPAGNTIDPSNRCAVMTTTHFTP